jgi:hypothetical protein
MGIESRAFRAPPFSSRAIGSRYAVFDPAVGAIRERSARRGSAEPRNAIIPRVAIKPHCVVCGFDSDAAGSVVFADYDPAWVEPTNPGWSNEFGVTAPPGVVLFCERHLAEAQGLRHLPARAAVGPLIERETAERARPKFCGHCGASLPRGFGEMILCRVCGRATPVAADPDATVTFCPGCRLPVPAVTAHCLRCGAALRS